MSSSISTSSKWRRLLLAYTLCTICIGLLISAAALALDPYDTGHFAVFGSYGVPSFGPRMADASLGRASAFNVAIFGNSTMQMIDPARLSNDELRAVSLTIPGTGPREQLSVAHWFVRQHPGHVRALVFGISKRWCAANDEVLDVTHPFPFWLYGERKSAYLAGFLQMKSLEAAGRKIDLIAGRKKPRRADGYDDYDVGRTWDRDSFLSRVAVEDGMEEPEGLSELPYHFAAAGLLKGFLTEVPDDTVVVLAMPPQYHLHSDARVNAQHRACYQAFASLAAHRPHTYMIDFLARSDLTSREEDYWDRSHYRAHVAREMEQEIAGRLSKPTSDH